MELIKTEILTGDCLELLTDFPDNFFNLIVTSPPYADRRNKTYGGIKPDEYVDWFLPRSAEFLRVLKPDGTFILNIKEKAINGERHTYVIELILEMKDNFKKAKRILGTNTSTGLHVIAVNGCCYGKDNTPNKGDYLKLCGQRFWEFISGNENLYTEIVEPLGHKAKEKNDLFLREYAKVINKFSLKFMKMFCDPSGEILWEEVIKFNSGKNIVKA